jgi:phosphoribosylglycinamide formyltransferase-1
MKKTRLAILASGSGSNAEAIMNWARTSEVASVVCLGCNVKNAPVLERADKFSVPHFTLLKSKMETREDYDLRLSEALGAFTPDWIILAGFMRLLSHSFLKNFHYQVINIHPSLLPAFPGVDGYGDAFRARVKESGCTVHYVDEGLDSGKIIAQKKFPLLPNESLEDFKNKGLAIENQFYPSVLDQIFKGKI